MVLISFSHCTQEKGMLTYRLSTSKGKPTGHVIINITIISTITVQRMILR